MITAISIKERDYIVKSDRKSENPTVFKIRSVDLFESDTIHEENRAREKDKGAGNASATVRYFKRGLLGWTNFKDPEGNELPFTEAGACAF